MRQRLDDRIKDLCAKAVATPQSPELNEILQELQAALAEHTRRLRKLVADFPARAKADLPTMIRTSGRNNETRGNPMESRTAGMVLCEVWPDLRSHFEKGC
jgi:hypothetical protein